LGVLQVFCLYFNQS